MKSKAIILKDSTHRSNTVLLFRNVLRISRNRMFWRTFENPVFLVGLIAASCWLLISPIKMIALKFKSMKLKDNYPKLILLLGGILLISILGLAGIPMVIVFI